MGVGVEDDKVHVLRADQPPEEKPSLVDLIEGEYVQLLVDMKRQREEDAARLREARNADKEGGEGAGGSQAVPSVVSFAERARTLNSATEFLLKLQKVRPTEKPASGINSLRSRYADPASRAGRRRNS